MNLLKIEKNIFPALLVRSLGALSGLVMSFGLAKWLSIDDVGTFFTLLTILTLLGTASTLGFNVAVMKSISEYYADNNFRGISNIFWFGFFVITCSSIFFAVTLYFASEFLSIRLFGNSALKNLLIIISAVIPFFALITYISHAFQGIRRFLLALTLQRIIFPFLVVLYVGFSVYFESEVTIINALDGIVAAVIISFCLGVSVWLFKVKSPSRWNFKIHLNIFKIAGPLWIVLFANLLNSWSGILISSILFDSYYVALYSIAARLSLLSTIALEAVNMVVAPLFSEAYKNSKVSELKKISVLSVRYLLLISLPVLVFFIMFSGDLLSIFGGDYKEAANVLRVLAVGQFFNAVTGSVSFLLIMTGGAAKVMKASVLCAIITIITAIVFGNLFGIYGVALGSAFGLVSQNVILVLFVKNQLGFNTLDIFKKD